MVIFLELGQTVQALSLPKFVEPFPRYFVNGTSSVNTNFILL